MITDKAIDMVQYLLTRANAPHYEISYIENEDYDILEYYLQGVMDSDNGAELTCEIKTPPEKAHCNTLRNFYYVECSQSPVNAFNSFTNWQKTVVRIYEDKVETVKVDFEGKETPIKRWNTQKSENF